MNVVFMGTPDFAVPSLENIAKVQFCTSCLYSAG